MWKDRLCDKNNGTNKYTKVSRFLWAIHMNSIRVLMPEYFGGHDQDWESNPDY